jgi:hypothetical protein
VRDTSFGAANREWHAIGRIGVCDGEIAAFEQAGDFIGIDFIIFGFSAVDGLHIQSVAQDEGDVVVCAEVGQPAPAKDAFHADHDVIEEGEDQFKEEFRIVFDILVRCDLAAPADDADVHFSGAQIDPAVVFVLLSVESHDVASF